MSTAPDVLDRYAWWTSLSHGGLLLSPSKLAEFFPAELPPLEKSLADRLRRDLTRLREGGDGTQTKFLDTVLEDVLGLHTSRWLKGSQVDKSWSRAAVTKEIIRPRRVWLGPGESVLPVFVADASLGGHDEGLTRLGVGRGRRAVSRVVEWLRKANQKLALLVGGRHLRLIHAGSDYDAYCEWDTELWFAEGVPGPQVTALRALLGAETLSPAAEGKPSHLLLAIQATRQGQAELSAMLGERVRQAVETLIHASAPVLEKIDRPGPDHVSRRDIYIAATRIVMRAVVVLFAEARQDDLLPRNNPIYEQSYGLSSLREQLDRLAGGRASERLRHSYSAWPRLLGLFDLLYHGSGHEKLPVTRYGGGLFMPGNATSRDGVLRALAAFESPDNSPSDAAMHHMLELLTRSPVKVRQGKTTQVVHAPVDFSDLSSEYIGILYEGLLDFELRRAPDDEAMVFLNLGDEPVLPISRLDRMTSDELAQLLEKLAKGAKKSGPDEDDGEEAEDESEGEESEAAAEADAEPTAETTVEADVDDMQAVREKIQLWAERAVKAAKLVKYPRNDKDPRVRDAFAQEVAAKARGLIKKSVMPGAWFLVRWGGTRKGSGTFYTRPQLAGPTVRRALEPLAYVPVEESKDAATGLVTVTEWAPKKPDEILALKVCDPAMGSGSFLISALRYLTDALFTSLHHHGRLDDVGDGVIPRLADGLPADHPWNETLPVPKDHPDFDKTLRARLKRHVVERCIYGVDLDPLAVELAKTALWVETMDPKLPLGFFDHKLKCGNSLVGCWFDRFQDYPIMAWEREGGDAKHDRFVHHYREVKDRQGNVKKKSGDKWTNAIKERRDEAIKDLRDFLGQQFGQTHMEYRVNGRTAAAIHEDASKVLQGIHETRLVDVQRQEERYREDYLDAQDIKGLRNKFDLWCALWFWPADENELVKAPLPSDFSNLDDTVLDVVRRVREEMRFFHWELEFPDVFAQPGSGFDAMVGNPPWEIQKPNSMEFFSNIDPLYRTYGKQEALQKQDGFFKDLGDTEANWLRYNARFKALSNWTRSAAYPFGGDGEQGEKLTLGRGQDGLLEKWSDQRSQRIGYADAAHPFRYQGSADLNTYKMFIEYGHALLARGGRLALIVRSGLYGDDGANALRKLIFKVSGVSDLYAFQNERGVFPSIHHTEKMCIPFVIKHEVLHSTAMLFRLGIANSPSLMAAAHDVEKFEDAIRIATSDIERLSPSSFTLLEITNRRDLEIIGRMLDASITLEKKCNEYQLAYRCELHMTNDSKMFIEPAKIRAAGFVENQYGEWQHGNSSALPVLEGRSIGQFDFQRKGWVSGRGRRAVWREVDWPGKRFSTQYLILADDYQRKVVNASRWKFSFMDVAASNVERTMIGAVVDALPCGNSAPVLAGPNAKLSDILSLACCLNSFVYDFFARRKCTRLHLNWFVIADSPIPKSVPAVDFMTRATASLSFCHERFACAYMQLAKDYPNIKARPWRSLWAVTGAERLRLRCILDALVARAYGMSANDMRWILDSTAFPSTSLKQRDFACKIDSKTFWLVDRENDPELRHTVLSLVAFHDLERMGLDAFLSQHEGEGWMLPETLRLADYGLGHDERAKEAQPVAAAMGPRFLPWQLEQGVEESWEECKKHAETIEKILGLTPQPPTPHPPAPSPTPLRSVERGSQKPLVTTEGQALMLAPEAKELPPQMNLFGIEEKQTGKKKGKRG